MAEELSHLITRANGYVGESLTERRSDLPETMKPYKTLLISRNKVDIKLVAKLDVLEVSSTSVDLHERSEVKFDPTRNLNFAAGKGTNLYSEGEANGLFIIIKYRINWSERHNSPKTFHACSGACCRFVSLTGNQISRILQKIIEKKNLFTDSRVRAKNKINEVPLSAKLICGCAAFSYFQVNI